jgi:hypothetical protein
MKMNPKEQQFLSTWIGEVLDNDFNGPAHYVIRQNVGNDKDLVTISAAWSKVEGKPEAELANHSPVDEPEWPWTPETFLARLEEAMKIVRPVEVSVTS